MFGEKKLKIIEERDRLSISFRWFSPKGIFLMFFTLFWIGFLIFWYAMVFASGAPAIFQWFPIIHVLVGLYLGYYSSCILFNRTYIDLDREFLDVVHRPIPWWRGNKHLDINTIRQLYVKETITRSKNGQNYKYYLRAKLVDGSDVPVVAVDNVGAAQIQEIEERLEEFLGIPDEPVKGEHGKGISTKPTYKVPPRRQSHRIDSPLSYWYESKKGDVIDYHRKPLDLLNVTQLDWKDGNSDKLFQLVNEYDSETLLYFIQNKALIHAFEELTLSMGEARQLNFSRDSPPSELRKSGRPYLLESEKSGRVFIPGIFPAIEVKQWLYFNKNKTEYLRITDKEGQLSFSRGQKVYLEDFGKGLDLNTPPPRPELEDRGYDEEDFV